MPLIIGYFVHDAVDMLQYECSRYTMELLLHHFASSLAFVIAVSSRKFVPFAYFALLMEVNSVFLHIRTMMQITKTSTTNIYAYRFVQAMNIIT